MTKLSLSDSLQGVKRRKSSQKDHVTKPVPKQIKRADNKRLPDSKKISVSSTKQVKAASDQHVKVIRQTPKATKQRRSKKTSGISPQKDIFKIQQQIQETQKPSPQKPVPQKPVPQKPVPQKPVPQKLVPQKPVLKKPSEDAKRRRRSKTRRRSRSRSRSRVREKMIKNQHTRSGKQKPSDDVEDIETIKQKIQEIRNKKSKYIREHLKKQGVRVSGKSDRLLKDIYFYSTACNVNIKHEQ